MRPTLARTVRYDLDEWELEGHENWRRYGDAKRARELCERDLAPDERLDDLGWSIFFLGIFRGQSVGEAARNAMDGNYRQRKRVHDDMFRRLYIVQSHRYRELRPGAAEPEIFDTDAAEQLKFWAARLTQPSYVYFIQEGSHGPVKIGLSNRPERRLGDLQTGNPDEILLRHVIPGNRTLEAALHRRFEPARIRGEWFGDVFDADYLAVILAFGAGLAETMLERYDGRGDPPVLSGSIVRTPAEIEQLRTDINRMWTNRHDDASIARYLGVDEDELLEHLDFMSRSSIYDVRGRFNKSLRPGRASSIWV